MKQAFLILLVSIFCFTALGQGTVNFFNSPSTLISVLRPGYTGIMPPNSDQIYYFALLTAPAGTTDPTTFTFTGAYGTNQWVAGRFTGGPVTISGWVPGTTRAVMVAGWDGTLVGHDFQESWLSVCPLAPFGLSPIGESTPGGYNPSTGGIDPNPIIFGPAGIAPGFTIASIPEPTAFALAGLCMAARLLLRRGK